MFITTFKKGRMPDVYADVEKLLQGDFCEHGDLLRGEGRPRFGEIFCWGRRRWNIENVFKEQKHSGFGLMHRFVNARKVNRVWYLMMQIAWTLWQLF